MKNILLFIVSIVFIAQAGFGQEVEETKKKKDKPVRSPFESAYLIDNQTQVIPTANTLESVIQHRFGTIDNGVKDLWGVYASGANTRIGFNYSLMDNLLVGWGITKDKMYNDFQVKYNVIQQTRKNTIPVTVTLYGNMAIDGRNEVVFGKNYTFTNRFSYFSQLIVGHKFSDWVSVQVNTSFTHYNSVVKTGDHDKMGVGFSGRFKFSPQSSILFQYDMPLKIKGISEQTEWLNHPMPNVGIGYEVSTSTHAFQVFLSSARGMIPQEIYMFNQNDWTDAGLVVGFNITRLWSF
ncbi:MAG: hypothetical protein JEZ03_02470 [Bacteroidales bacterium]|nr:hypothetical protein [Bacteroidales bacterium]